MLRGPRFWIHRAQRASDKALTIWERVAAALGRFRRVAEHAPPAVKEVCRILGDFAAAFHAPGILMGSRSAPLYRFAIGNFIAQVTTIRELQRARKLVAFGPSASNTTFARIVDLVG